MRKILLIAIIALVSCTNNQPLTKDMTSTEDTMAMSLDIVKPAPPIEEELQLVRNAVVARNSMNEAIEEKSPAAFNYMYLEGGRLYFHDEYVAKIRSYDVQLSDWMAQYNGFQKVAVEKLNELRIRIEILPDSTQKRLNLELEYLKTAF